MAPTTDEEEKEKLAGIWRVVKERAIKAAREEKLRAEKRNEAPEVQALKRARVEPSRSSTPASVFSSFGRRAAVGGDGSSGVGGAERDPVAEAVEGDIVRYQAHFMIPDEVCVVGFGFATGESVHILASRVFCQTVICMWALLCLRFNKNLNLNFGSRNKNINAKMYSARKKATATRVGLIEIKA